MSDYDRVRGLYRKYIVMRADGRMLPPDFEAFVLRLDKGDKHAIAALKAYAESCAEEYPLLAEDLQHTIARNKREER